VIEMLEEITLSALILSDSDLLDPLVHPLQCVPLDPVLACNGGPVPRQAWSTEQV
jgi:hypothetical protein